MNKLEKMRLELEASVGKYHAWLDEYTKLLKPRIKFDFALTYQISDNCFWVTSSDCSEATLDDIIYFLKKNKTITLEQFKVL